MPSAWVEHIRDFAKRNNLTYGCALSDPKCSEEYRIKFPKPAKKGKKGKKLDLSKTEFTPLEEAEIDKEPKTKMIVEKKPPKEPKAPKRKTKTTPEPKAVRDWVFKPTKNNYGSTEVERAYMLNALPNDRKIAEEGLYKNDRAEDFNVIDFKDAIDKNKKPETSVLLRIAKYLQKNKFGKIVYSKVAAKAPEPKGKGITTKNISKNITCGMPLSHSMILKMVGDGLSKMYGGSLSGSESDEELTKMVGRLGFTVRREADNSPPTFVPVRLPSPPSPVEMETPSGRQGVSLTTAIARKPAPPKITGAKRNTKSPEAIGESSSGKKQVTQK